MGAVGSSGWRRSWPHFIQNLPVRGVSVPHFGQWNSIGLPHSIQNVASSGLSNWHFGHFIPVLLRGGSVGAAQGAKSRRCSIL